METVRRSGEPPTPEGDQRVRLHGVSWAAYDRYLKANRVNEGVRSYSRVLELLATARFSEDWVPEIKAQGSRPKAQE